VAPFLIEDKEYLKDYKYAVRLRIYRHMNEGGQFGPEEDQELEDGTVRRVPLDPTTGVSQVFRPACPPLSNTSSR
jgi:hypothetical protein